MTTQWKGLYDCPICLETYGKHYIQSCIECEKLCLVCDDCVPDSNNINRNPLGYLYKDESPMYVCDECIMSGTTTNIETRLLKDSIKRFNSIKYFIFQTNIKLNKKALKGM